MSVEDRTTQLESIVAEQAKQIVNLKTELASFIKNYKRETRYTRECQDWIDTFSSPILKRIWFWLKGYRWKRLGRWYMASWNEDAAPWDDRGQR